MTQVRDAKLSELTPDAHNANKGTERGRYMLDHSLRQYGAGRSILVDKHGKVIAGNKTLEAAADIGLEDMVIVRTTGDKLVVVQRDDLDLDDGDDKARLMAYADNRTGQFMEWDADALKLDIDAGLDLSDMFRDEELIDLGVLTIEPPADPGAQVDRAAELQEKWQVQRGQVWEVGRHRVMCGDSTSAEDVGRLMGGERAYLVFEDPPYGIGYVGWTLLDTHAEDIENDERDGEIGAFYASHSLLLGALVCPGASVYVFYSPSRPECRAAFNSNGWKIKDTIAWVKPTFAPGRNDYQNQWESLLYAYRTGGERRWCGRRALSNVWTFDRDRDIAHPTNKPVALVAYAIANSSKQGDVVLDLFLGSGTTMVAAENTGRLCRGMEIEPKYVAVTLERLAGMGLEPRLVQN